MMRCMLCRKKVDNLSEHNLCEECEKKFDFDQGEPYFAEEEEDEGSAKTQIKRILVTSGCAVALILFLIWVIPFLMSLFNVQPS